MLRSKANHYVYCSFLLFFSPSETVSKWLFLKANKTHLYSVFPLRSINMLALMTVILNPCPILCHLVQCTFHNCGFVDCSVAQIQVCRMRLLHVLPEWSVSWKERINILKEYIHMLPEKYYIIFGKPIIFHNANLYMASLLKNICTASLSFK